jgi:hypothetical protein
MTEATREPDGTHSKMPKADCTLGADANRGSEDDDKIGEINDLILTGAVQAARAWQI